MKKTLAVCGTFGDDGKPSGYANHAIVLNNDGFTIINGGTLADLEAAFVATQSVDVVIWMPKVDNDVHKYVDQIKVNNPHAYLVISKSNINKQYSTLELIARALRAKANLLVEFTRIGGQIAATILDPLGNAFTYQETDVLKVKKELWDRLDDIVQFTRASSFPTSLMVPSINEEQTKFIEIARNAAQNFHSLVHAVNQERFVGNLSFRCENGFPSMRSGDGIFVSRRNVDKRTLSAQDMVYVRLDHLPDVYYSGSAKPSVDTPVQKWLYALMPKIQYMLHGHVYLKNPDFTTAEPIPCGALEETSAIMGDHWWYDRSHISAKINLKGHGFLILATDLKVFENIEYVERALPEII